MVNWNACRVVQDRLTWHDHDIPAEVVQRVEFQRKARIQSDYLEDTVVKMMFKWGLFGPTADQGLMLCAKRHWVASVWEWTYLLSEWETVKDEEEPQVSLLQLLSQQGHGEGRKRGGGAIKFLSVDPAFYDHIFVPIYLKSGKHWLLASVDVQAQKTQLVDSSKRYGRKWLWRGQIHSILWVWFFASVKKLRATGAAIKEEPQWEIVTRTGDPFRMLWIYQGWNPLRYESTKVRSKLEAGRLEERPPDIGQ
jgi:hypothetical protein